MPEVSKEKVLLISIDNLRYDCVSYVKERPHLKQFYVENLIDTPTLDEIAENCSVFTNFFSTSSYTTAAHASLFTGLLSPKHGVRPFFYKKLREDCITAAEVYKKNGYKTVLYSDVIELFQPLGLTKGFDFVFAGDINALFKQLSSNELKDEKVFCFTHLFDAHEPYIYSQNYNENNYNDDYFAFMRKMSVLYKIPINNNDPFSLWNSFSGKVSFNVQIMLPAYIYGINKFDKGRFRIIHNTLKNLGYFDENNIYAIFADHGEGRITLFDQPVFGHMGELFDEVTRVPFIMHAPQIKKGINDKLASMTDVFPTLVQLSGLNVEYAAEDGMHLLDEREYCYSEFCTQNMYNEIMQFASPVYDRNRNGASMNDRYFLSQRAVRTKDKKYLFIPDNISASDAQKIIENIKLSDEDFIIAMFNNVMRKRISKQEYMYMLNMLKSKKTTRQDIYKGIISTEIYNRPKNYYYDLNADPFEETPILLNLELSDSKKIIEILNKVENKAVVSSDLFASAPSQPAPAVENGQEKSDKPSIVLKEASFSAASSDFAGESASLLKEKISIGIDIIKVAR